MRFDPSRRTLLAFAAVCCFPSGQAADEPTPVASEEIVVTATRTTEDRIEIPVSITTLSGGELAARGVTDLASALATVAGVVAAPGGDAGPAGAVPEFWGLREFDAFLLVVDDVPWGGAFLPALTAVDMHNIERIEILRGAAPVMYGATSFVGVIHVIHRVAGAEGREGQVRVGSYGSYSAAYTTPLPCRDRWKQSLSADLEKQGFRADRTEYRRGHLLYRGAAALGAGSLTFDADLLALRQDPASPTPRTGAALTDLVPIDANNNPADARIDDDRLHLAVGYRRPQGKGEWATKIALTHTQRDVTRGFLTDIASEGDNAAGFRQDAKFTDLYFDTHLSLPLAARLHLVTGVDHLFGKGRQESENFTYFVPLDGTPPPASRDQPIDEATDLRDERNFTGLYAQLEWKPVDALRVEVGARLNHTKEKLEGATEVDGIDEPSRDSRSITRGSGVIGVAGRLWLRDKAAVWAFVDYRNGFKPAVVDFGPESEADLLAPEQATSWEGGFKGRLGDDRLEWQVSGFRMNFNNIVVPQAIDGVPTLVNAGKVRFEGAEVELSYRITPALRVQATFARHEARFRDFVQLFGDMPTQLRGNRFEMSARTLGGAAITYAPETGLTGFVSWNYTGDRYLNKRNTALAGPFSLWAAGIGYRFGKQELRCDGSNLGDRRDPITESELGDAQYYRQPARRFTLSWVARY